MLRFERHLVLDIRFATLADEFFLLLLKVADLAVQLFYLLFHALQRFL